MHIDITLGGALVKYLPADTTGNALRLSLDHGETLMDVLQRLSIPDNRPMMAILNGELIQAERYQQAILADGDALSLVPPIQAG